MYYKLSNNNEVVRCSDFSEWLQWARSRRDFHVALDTPYPGVKVSTVFIAVQAALEPEDFFETMVFGGTMDLKRESSSTWDEALKTHKRMMEEASNG